MQHPPWPLCGNLRMSDVEEAAVQRVFTFRRSSICHNLLAVVEEAGKMLFYSQRAFNFPDSSPSQ
jgi:hypothetical protein